MSRVLIGLLIGFCSCLSVDCHLADSTCNPIVTILLNTSSEVTCPDPDYAVPAGATIVSNPADSGAGSLRQAIADVAAGGAIDLTDVGGSIVLASVLPTIAKDIDLYGACGPTQIIDGAGGSGSTSAAGGTPGTFGGTGATGCTGVNNNDAGGGGGGGGLGGAIAVHGAGTTLTVSDSIFINNTATGGAGGAAVSCTTGGAGQGKGGAIFADAGAAVAQSNLIMTGNLATDQTAAANDNNNAFGFNFP